MKLGSPDCMYLQNKVWIRCAAATLKRNWAQRMDTSPSQAPTNLNTYMYPA